MPVPHLSSSLRNHTCSPGVQGIPQSTLSSSLPPRGPPTQTAAAPALSRCFPLPASQAPRLLVPSEPCSHAGPSPPHTPARPGCSGSPCFPTAPWEMSPLVLSIIQGRVPWIRDVLKEADECGSHTWFSFIPPISHCSALPLHCALIEVWGAYEAFS